MYTIDTNILIYHANGDPRVSAFLLSACEKDTPLILPTIAVVEFFSFPAMTPRVKEIFEVLLPYFRITDLDYPLSLAAAQLRRNSRLKLGDSIIAATALATHSYLVTRNVRDFKRIVGLKIIRL
ncbi:MAG: PilT protein domain-containing protein [Parcubacteria group bacterium Gr01-1014_49]|nr:MAG: PilT protein domain-containing protein [Parcubacteria group bacterium Gr01-1014_49]